VLDYDLASEERLNCFLSAVLAHGASTLCPNLFAKKPAPKVWDSLYFDFFWCVCVVRVCLRFPLFHKPS
jgi:hypothetical protein